MPSRLPEMIASQTDSRGGTAEPAQRRYASNCEHRRTALLRDVSRGEVGACYLACLDCGDRGPAAPTEAEARAFWQDCVDMLEAHLLAELGDPFSVWLVRQATDEPLEQGALL